MMILTCATVALYAKAKQQGRACSSDGDAYVFHSVAIVLQQQGYQKLPKFSPS